MTIALDLSPGELAGTKDEQIGQVVAEYRRLNNIAMAMEINVPIEAIIELYSITHFVLNDTQDISIASEYSEPNKNADGYPICEELNFDKTDSEIRYQLRKFFEATEKNFNKRYRQHIFDNMKKNAEIYGGSLIVYHFDEHEQRRIQAIINELRDYVVSSNLFDESHRRRILKRLEVLQSEIYKKVSDLDRFWGLVGDAGIAIGKFGEGVKPFVDRIRDLTKIISEAQARAEKIDYNHSPPLLDDNAQCD